MFGSRTARLPSIREFAAVIWGDWGSRVTGGLSVPFTAMALFSKADDAKALWGVCALIGILATIYQVWAAERKRVVILETELTTDADVRGSILVQTARSLPDTASSRIKYDIYCANHGKKSCEVSMILFDLVRLDGSEHHPFRVSLSNENAKRVGPGDRFACGGHEWIPMPLEELNQFSIKASLIDSLGVAYSKNIETMIVYAQLGGEGYSSSVVR